MSESFGTTACPKCERLIPAISDSLDWEYLCAGEIGNYCGGAFKFEKKKEDDDLGE